MLAGLRVAGIWMQHRPCCDLLNRRARERGESDFLNHDAGNIEYILEVHSSEQL